MTAHIKEATEAQKSCQTALMDHMEQEALVSNAFHERITELSTAIASKRAYMTGVVATVSVVFVVIQVIVSVAADLM